MVFSTTGLSLLIWLVYHAICTHLLELVSQSSSQFWWYQVGDPFDPYRKCNCGRLARDQRREGVGSPQEAGSAQKTNKGPGRFCDVLCLI